MKKSANKIIRKVLLGAVASILYPTDASATIEQTVPNQDGLSDGNDELVNALQRKTIKDVLRIKWRNDAHCRTPLALVPLVAFFALFW